MVKKSPTKPTPKAVRISGVEDPSQKAAKALALEKAKKTRAKATVKAKTEKHAGNMSTMSTNLEMNEIIDWVESKPHLQSWLAGIMRNGLLEADYNAMLKGKQDKVTDKSCGVMMFGEKAKTWGQMRLDPVKDFLAKLLGNNGVADWFKGPDKLPSELAAMAVYKLVGVRPITPVPRGIPLAHRSVPMLWLCKYRIATLGGLGNWIDVTKATFRVFLQFFILEDNPEPEQNGNAKMIYLQINGAKHLLIVKGVAWQDADDWTLENADDYEACELVSAVLRFRRSVWPMVKMSVGHEVHFDTEFHYPPDCKIPGVPDSSAPAAHPPKAAGADPGLAEFAAPAP